MSAPIPASVALNTAVNTSLTAPSTAPLTAPLIAPLSMPLTAAPAAATPLLPGSLQSNRRLSQWLAFHGDGRVTLRTGKVDVLVATDVAARPPLATWAARLAAARSKPATECPAFSKLAAIGKPLFPRPIRAMFMLPPAICGR